MGWVICKTVPYLQGVSVSASINTLVAISVERCLAICYPLKWQMTSRACRIVVVVIWTFSLIITLPWAIFFGLHPLEGSDVQVGSDFPLLKTSILVLRVSVIIHVKRVNDRQFTQVYWLPVHQGPIVINASTSKEKLYWLPVRQG
jgi:hypothetical protein